MATAWKPFEAKRGGMLIRWMFAESEARLLALLDGIPDQLFRPDNLQLVVGGPKLLLFDSAVPGRSLRQGAKPEEFLAIELDPGIYGLSTAYYKPDEQTSSIVHRFTWQQAKETP